MHTYVDDFIKWLNRTFLNREWHWPVTEPAGDGAGPAAVTSAAPPAGGAGAAPRAGEPVRAERP